MDPYPALLGLGWAMDMGGIFNLRKCSIVLEVEGIWVVIPLDPAEGERYTEPARVGEELDHIYKLTAKDQEWVKSTVEGMLCWEKESE